MNSAPVLMLVIISTVSFFVIRIGARALELTGVSRDAARFQALSAFFGVGFTTKESEMVVDHPLRRRMIRDLIIVGNIGVLSLLTTGVFTAINLDFSSPANTQQSLQWLTIIIVFLILLGLLSRSRIAGLLIDKSISSALLKFGMLKAMDYEQLLRTHAGYSVGEIDLEPGSWLCGKTIRQAALRERGVTLLGLTRQNGQYIASPQPDTAMCVGDSMLLYGSDNALQRIAEPNYWDLKGAPGT